VGQLALGDLTQGHDAAGLSAAVSPDGGTVHADLDDITTIAYQPEEAAHARPQCRNERTTPTRTRVSLHSPAGR
jgi:hypothetical protein